MQRRTLQPSSDWPGAHTRMPHACMPHACHMHGMQHAHAPAQTSQARTPQGTPCVIRHAMRHTIRPHAPGYSWARTHPSYLSERSLCQPGGFAAPRAGGAVTPRGGGARALDAGPSAAPRSATPRGRRADCTQWLRLNAFICTASLAWAGGTALGAALGAALTAAVDMWLASLHTGGLSEQPPLVVYATTMAGMSALIPCLYLPC